LIVHTFIFNENCYIFGSLNHFPLTVTMKSVLVRSLLALSVCISFTKCTLIQKDKLDPKLLGSWSGFEKDNQRENLTKYWIQHRFEDGTFILLFTTIDHGKVDSFVEKGKWWVEHGVFHELHFISGKTDTFTYAHDGKNSVKFKAKNIAIPFENDQYEFSETKIDEN
jgi:hypothetical protein